MELNTTTPLTYAPRIRYYGDFWIYKLMGTTDNVKAESWITWFFAIIIMTIFGLFGNISTIVILCSPELRHKSYALLMLFLACSDTIQVGCVFVGWLSSFMIYLKSPRLVDFKSDTACILGSYIPMATTFASAWLMVGISLQRALIVRFPFAGHFFDKTKSRTFATVILIFALTIALPSPLTLIHIPGLSQRCVKKTKFEYNNLLSSYILYLSVIIPASLIVFANIVIIVTLILNSKKKLSSTSSNKDTIRITILLVTLSMAFVCLLIPDWIYGLSGARKRATSRTLGRFTGFLQSLNYCINFYIYIISGNEMRTVFLTIIGVKK